MEELTQLKTMMGDLHQQREKMKVQAQELKSLRSEILTLQGKAASDPIAKKKLQKLDEVMKNGGQRLCDLIHQRAGKVEISFKQLGEQLKQLSPGDGASTAGRTPGDIPSPKPRVTKKNRRAFA